MTMGRRWPMRIKTQVRVMTGWGGEVKRQGKNDDDLSCYILCLDFLDKGEYTQKLWAGCDNHPNWCCPRCFADNFDHQAEYMCLDCQQSSKKVVFKEPLLF